MSCQLVQLRAAECNLTGSVGGCVGGWGSRGEFSSTNVSSATLRAWFVCGGGRMKMAHTRLAGRDYGHILYSQFMLSQVVHERACS